MRVLGVLAAWGVLAVLATLCFAVGGSIGYRRGVQDAVRQLRERRSGKTGCRPLPLPHHRRRPIARIHASPLRSAQAKAAAPPAIHRLRAQFSRPNLSPALAGAMATVFLLAVPGVAVGATTAQPGETLWPVKRGMEGARLAMATSPDSEMQIYVELASRRLNELNHLLAAEQADPQVVATVITDLRDHTEAASQQLQEVDVAQRRQVAQRVQQVIRRQVMAIDVLLDIDCTDEAQDDKCVALGDTRVASEQLHQETVTVAMAGNDAVAGARPLATAGVATDDRPSETGMVSTPENPSTSPDTAALSGAQPSEGTSAGAASEATSDDATESSSTPPAAGSTTPPSAAAAGNDEPATGTASTTTPADGGDGSDATKTAEQATAAPAP